MKTKSPRIVGSKAKTRAMFEAILNRKVDREVVIKPSLSFLINKLKYSPEKAAKLLRG